jgi:hypothetical protein
MDISFKRHTILSHVSKHAIDNCLKLKLSGTYSSTLRPVSFKILRWPCSHKQKTKADKAPFILIFHTLMRKAPSKEIKAFKSSISTSMPAITVTIATGTGLRILSSFSKSAVSLVPLSSIISLCQFCHGNSWTLRDLLLNHQH